MTMTEQTFDVMAVLNAATRILAARVLTMVCLFMTFGLFCWAMWMQTITACSVAGGFAIFVFLPVLFDGRRREQSG
jgi:ABC-type proline/glycine betaine transport system permease subunit